MAEARQRPARPSWRPDISAADNRGMPTVHVAEMAADETSEDVVLTLPNAVALLDGATSLRPTSHTGGWYAEKLAEALRPRLGPESVAESPDLAEVLFDAIAEVQSRHDLRPGSSPSSTVSLLRWNENVVQALVLADSPVVVFTDNGEQAITDERLAKLGGTSRTGYRARLREGGGFDGAHHAALRDAVDATARWRNVTGGFWVAEADPQAARQSVRREWPRSSVRAALLASDGVSCGFDKYDCYPNWSAMLEHADRESAEAVLRRVREAERSDPDGLRWPRAKRHDDQALAIVRFDRDGS